MDRVAQLEKELEIARLEAELVAAKDSGEVSQELKLRIREARRAFREEREGAAAEVAEGGAVARPATIEATGEVDS